MHQLISLFAVCNTPLRAHEELSVTAWNYTYLKLEIACYKFSSIKRG